MKKNKLSVILPVHNEAAGIKEFLTKTVSTLEKNSITYEIICIENGSTDDTYSIINKIKSQFPKVYLYTSKKGWGNAVRKGIKKARGDVFCYLVSDNQVDPEYIAKVYFSFLSGSDDLVKIYRITRENLKRLIMTKIYNCIAKIMFGLNSRDINATPKIIRTSLIRSLKLKSNNIALDIELLVKLKKAGHAFVEIPAKSNSRSSGRSTTNYKAIIEMILEMIRLHF